MQVKGMWTSGVITTDECHAIENGTVTVETLIDIINRLVEDFEIRRNEDERQLELKCE